MCEKATFYDFKRKRNDFSDANPKW